MRAFQFVVIFQVLYALQAKPYVSNITHLDDAEEVDLSWRLPTAIRPSTYHIDLDMKVHENGNRDYSGSVIIFLDVMEATNKIVLHSKDLNILDLLLFSGVTTVDELIYYEDETRDFLVIETNENFEAGDDLMLLIEFTGQLQLQGVGFYRSEYRVGGETRYLAVTQFEAGYARYAFPVFDGNYSASGREHIKAS